MITIRCNTCHTTILESASRVWDVPFDARRFYDGASHVRVCLDAGTCAANKERLATEMVQHQAQQTAEAKQRWADMTSAKADKILNM